MLLSDNAQQAKRYEFQLIFFLNFIFSCFLIVVKTCVHLFIFYFENNFFFFLIS